MWTKSAERSENQVLDSITIITKTTQLNSRQVSHTHVLFQYMSHFVGRLVGRGRFVVMAVIVIVVIHLPFAFLTTTNWPCSIITQIAIHCSIVSTAIYNYYVFFYCIYLSCALPLPLHPLNIHICISFVNIIIFHLSAYRLSGFVFPYFRSHWLLITAEAFVIRIVYASGAPIRLLNCILPLCQTCAWVSGLGYFLIFPPQTSHLRHYNFQNENENNI